MEYSTVIIISIYAVTAIVKHVRYKREVKDSDRRLLNLERDSEVIKTRLRAAEEKLPNKPSLP